MTETVLRLPEVMSRVGLSKSSLYSLVATGTFPAPIPLGARARGWLASEVASFVDGRIRERQEAQARRSVTEKGAP